MKAITPCLMCCASDVCLHVFVVCVRVCACVLCVVCVLVCLHVSTVVCVCAGDNLVI